VRPTNTVPLFFNASLKHPSCKKLREIGLNAYIPPTNQARLDWRSMLWRDPGRGWDALPSTKTVQKQLASHRRLGLPYMRGTSSASDFVSTRAPPNQNLDCDRKPTRYAYVIHETEGYNMGYRSTAGGGATNLEPDRKRQIRETTFLPRGEEEEGKSLGGDGIEGRGVGDLRKHI